MTRRWKLRVREEMGQVQDLVRVLFKPRNGQPWTAEDRAFLKRELRALARRWAPGFFLFLLPGGMLLASWRRPTRGISTGASVWSCASAGTATATPRPPRQSRPQRRKSPACRARARADTSARLPG